MSVLRHEFTHEIVSILDQNTQGYGEYLLQSSELIQYLNIKTKAAHRGSKSRASFANHYALYVLIEDYLNGHFEQTGRYADYQGAKFSALLQRQRALPFGSKLQNHALNHRLNEEFKKYFPICEYIPIIRDAKNNRYWINEKLLIYDNINLAYSVKEIIEAYVKARQCSFSAFMTYCQEIIKIQAHSPDEAVQFIKTLFQPNVDARIFEIASFAVLKQYYAEQRIYWGWSPEALLEDALTLYKTSRTNANDGGIDFVMRPLGRFFQVTETVEVGKYFLDIDKIQRYPITFVVKSNDSSADILAKITEQAEAKYPIKAIVKKYLEAIEEIINIPQLLERFDQLLIAGKGRYVIEEIILYSRTEFNIEAEAHEIDVSAANCIDE